VILYAVDADGIFVVAEGSGLERVGTTHADYLGTSVFERYRDRPQELAEIRRALAGEDVDSLLCRAGLVWEVRRRPIRHEGGEVSGVITVATDVTERHRAEQALEEVRHRHRMIIQNVSDLLFTIDGEGRIGFASPSSERVLGYRVEEVEGMNWVSLLHPDDEPRVREMTGPIPPGRTSAAIEHRVRRSDGTWLHMESRATNLLDDPRFGVWVVASRDITDRLEARVALESARDTAEAATRAKSELLANVSHEIRTPMNAILGMTDLALDTPLDPEQREYLSTVRSSAEALLTIIDDLLDLSRFEAGRVTVQRVPFSVRATLDDVVRTLKVRADQKGLALTVEVHDQVPEWVSGDPGRLRQVVMNLVGNAVKFTDAGAVAVTARPSEGTLVRFEVTDTGIGIAPEHLGTVFGVFEQADGGVNRRYGGTGLGLAISSKLVSLMGGSISAQSRVGEGSVFEFTCDLPAAVAGEAPAGGAARIGPVVVVADPPVRSRMAAQLESAGHAVVEVATRAGALTTAAALRAEGGEVAAVVVDISEPEDAACRRLTGSEVLGGVPVIAVVAAGRRGDGGLYRKAGYRAYLVRPLGDGDLAGAVEAVTTGIAGDEVLVTRHWLRERRRPLRVLVADDSLTNRAVASRVLEKRGHQVIQVADGESAVVAATRERFDVVIMDVQMPGVDGLEATRRIRATEGASPGRRTPVVALTAHATEPDRAACLAAGMDAYLSKPYRAEELLAVVESAAVARKPAEAGAAPVRVDPASKLRRHMMGSTSNVTEADRAGVEAG
jgi:PAS domain S-box-containing protein